MAGTTDFTFKARLRIGDEIVPIKTEIVSGASGTQDGVQNGFLFELDLEPGEYVTVNLDDIVNFIENKLGQSNIASAPGSGTISTNMPGSVFDENGKFKTGVAVDIQSFLINSNEQQKLFSISIDIRNTDPTKSLIALPGDFANWLKIKDLAIAFTAKKTTDTLPS